MTDIGLPTWRGVATVSESRTVAHFDRPLSVEDVLSGMTAAAVELTPAAVEVGVLLITQNRKFETHAATSRHVHHPHVLRERFCNGSALQATLYGAPIVCTHETSRPSADGRSTPVPSWTWGIRSAMSVRL